MTYPQLSGDCYEDFTPYMSNEDRARMPEWEQQMRRNNAIEEDINDAFREQEQAERQQWLETNEGVFRDEMQGEK